MKFPNIGPSYRARVVVACYERELVRGSTFAGKRVCVGTFTPSTRLMHAWTRPGRWTSEFFGSQTLTFSRLKMRDKYAHRLAFRVRFSAKVQQLRSSWLVLCKHRGFIVKAWLKFRISCDSQEACFILRSIVFNQTKWNGRFKALTLHNILSCWR